MAEQETTPWMAMEARPTKRFGNRRWIVVRKRGGTVCYFHRGQFGQRTVKFHTESAAQTRAAILNKRDGHG